MIAPIRELITQKWQSDWDKQVRNKLYSIHSSMSGKRNIGGLSRSEQVKLTRLRIGHCKLTHEYLLKGENPPRCQTCNVPLSIQHILLDCQKVQESRNKYLKNSNNMKMLFETTAKRDIISFLQETHLFMKLVIFFLFFLKDNEGKEMTNNSINEKR